MGFYNKDNEFYQFSTENKIDSKFVIEAVDTFVATRVLRPTVLVVDNASIHTSKLFMSKIEEWMEKERNAARLYIFYLPKYSPHLNLIEILWRFINGATIRYTCIEAKAYFSWENLVENIKQIFNQIGTKYTINFT